MTDCSADNFNGTPTNPSGNGSQERFADQPKGEQFAASPVKPRNSSKKTGVSLALEFKSFPLSVFPKPVRDFVQAGAKSIGCDPAMLAIPLLGVLSYAIGATRVIRVKGGWYEPALLWLLLICRSGSAKTPAQNLVTKMVRKWQEEAQKENQKQNQEFFSQTKKDQEAYQKPKIRQVFLKDATIESVAGIMESNPRGVLGFYDEWSQWHSLHGRYRANKGKGSEAADWLSMFNCLPIMVNRKSADQCLYAKRPYLPLIATTQPETYKAITSRDQQDSGMDARWLKAYPPQKAKRWTDKEVDESTDAKFCAVLEQLAKMEFRTNDSGDDEPMEVNLSPAAKAAWIQFYNEHNEEQNSMDESLGATWSKLECVAARLALILHCTRFAARDTVSEFSIDEGTMKDAICLTRWFGNEAKRIQAMLTETSEGAKQRRLIEWIQKQGGEVMESKLISNLRYPDTEAAYTALNDLVKKEIGYWEKFASPLGGPRTQRFILNRASETRENPLVIEGFTGNDLDVISPLKPESDAKDDSATDISEENGGSTEWF